MTRALDGRIGRRSPSILTIIEKTSASWIAHRPILAAGTSAWPPRLTVPKVGTLSKYRPSDKVVDSVVVVDFVSTCSLPRACFHSDFDQPGSK